MQAREVNQEFATRNQTLTTFGRNVHRTRDADARPVPAQNSSSDRIRCRVLFARIRSEEAQMDSASLRTPFTSTPSVGRSGYPHVLTCQSISPSPSTHSALHSSHKRDVNSQFIFATWCVMCTSRLREGNAPIALCIDV